MLDALKKRFPDLPRIAMVRNLLTWVISLDDDLAQTVLLGRPGGAEVDPATADLLVRAIQRRYGRPEGG